MWTSKCCTGVTFGYFWMRFFRINRKTCQVLKVLWWCIDTIESVRYRYYRICLGIDTIELVSILLPSLLWTFFWELPIISDIFLYKPSHFVLQTIKNRKPGTFFNDFSLVGETPDPRFYDLQMPWSSLRTIFILIPPPPLEDQFIGRNLFTTHRQYFNKKKKSVVQEVRQKSDISDRRSKGWR